MSNSQPYTAPQGSVWRWMTVSGGTLWLLAAVGCWGLAVPLSKSLLADLDPATLICVQLGTSVAMLGAAALVTRTPLQLPPRAALLPFILLGMLEPGVAYYLEFVGLQRTTALHAALIMTLEPAGIVCLNVLLWHFRRDVRLLLSVIVATLGVFIVVLGFGEEGGSSSIQGDAIVLAGTLAASVYVSLSTQLLKSEPVILLLLMQQVSSLGFAVVVCALWIMLGHAPAPAPGGALLGAGGVGCLQFALAFFFYFRGVRSSSGYWGVVVLNLAPVVGVAASVLLLRETTTPLYYLGAALCLATSLYTRAREHRLDQQPAAGPEQTPRPDGACP